VLEAKIGVANTITAKIAKQSFILEIVLFICLISYLANFHLRRDVFGTDIVFQIYKVKGFETVQSSQSGGQL